MSFIAKSSISVLWVGVMATTKIYLMPEEWNSTDNCIATIMCHSCLLCCCVISLCFSTWRIAFWSLTYYMSDWGSHFHICLWRKAPGQKATGWTTAVWWLFTTFKQAGMLVAGVRSKVHKQISFNIGSFMNNVALRTSVKNNSLILWLCASFHLSALYFHP